MISITTAEPFPYPVPSQSLAAFPIDPAQGMGLEVEQKARISLQGILKLQKITNFISKLEDRVRVILTS